jgi:hypothetical protein
MIKEMWFNKRDSTNATEAECEFMGHGIKERAE